MFVPVTEDELMRGQHFSCVLGKTRGVRYEHVGLQSLTTVAERFVTDSRL